MSAATIPPEKRSPQLKRYHRIKAQKGSRAYKQMRATHAKAEKKYKATEKGKRVGALAARRTQRRLRLAVLALLGGKCVRCDWADERALQVDHIHGGGVQEHKKLGGRGGVYRRVLKHPEDYQLLCATIIG